MRKLLCALAAAALTSCSVYPLPDDVSPVPTEEIVRNLRCEVKDAVRNEIVEALRRLDPNNVFGIQGIPPEDILEEGNLVRVARVSYPFDKNAGARVATKIVFYAYLTIAFEFEFDITETNSASLDTTFLRPLSNGTFTLNASAGLDKTRRGVRTFATVDALRELRELKCRDRVIHDRNILYPITGKIGMDKVIHTFIWLNEPDRPEPVPQGPYRSDVPERPYRPYMLGMGNDEAAGEDASRAGRVRTAQVEGSKSGSKGEPKSKAKDDSKSKPKDTAKPKEKTKPKTKESATVEVTTTGSKIKTDAFVDTLTFTTEWKGGLNPVLELNPVPHSLRLVKGDLNLGAGRKDAHKVTISLAFPDKKEFRSAELATVDSVLRLNRAMQFVADAAKDQAALNLCIALAKKREQEFGTLRLAPPEQYCTLYSSRVPQPNVVR